jgi:hypothetical protein
MTIRILVPIEFCIYIYSEFFSELPANRSAAKAEESGAIGPAVCRKLPDDHTCIAAAVDEVSITK